MYNLSVVNIVPDAYKNDINAIASLYGCGEGNLSVKLINPDNNIYWGCHSFWKPEYYAIFSDDLLRAEVVPPELTEALTHLYERLVLGGDPQDNWNNALTELNLVLYTVEEVV